MRLTAQRILCIDNNASSNLAVYLLESAGYEVTMTTSIADAIDLIQCEQFDLHLLNHKLLLGLEIESCDKLHAIVPRTPILFYSTVSYPYQQIQAIHCRLHDHMLKPINVSEVVPQVFRLLKKKIRAGGRTLRQDREIKSVVGA
jgi:DNA-binding response OmpR family regulator